ncbi:MAG: hybrid sensor histidine kinase/response regulator [Cyanobacteriota bacterium]|nr:hybrid sensor histidine kinase/response regulator [Cyanobacteriota bacterium]
MTVDTTDRAYEFFVEEATELLEVLERGLMRISSDRELEKIHDLMRAAHSIKGGAACIGLMGIQKIAHNLENGIRALYREDLLVDMELENLLLQAFDSLREPIIQQIQTGQYNEEEAIALSLPIFQAVEAKLGHSLEEAAELPEVSMGGDMTKFLFAEEIPPGLSRWEDLLGLEGASMTPRQVIEELKSQAEVFATLGSMLNLSGFTAIAESAIKAFEANPKYYKTVGKIALADLQGGREAVLGGDRSQGGKPSKNLLKLTTPQKPRITGVSPVRSHQKTDKPPAQAKKTDPPKSDVASARQRLRSTSAPALGVRVDLDRLEMLTNFVGELATEDNSLLLQNQQSQTSLETVEKGWNRFYQLMVKLQENSGKERQELKQTIIEEIVQIGEAIYDLKLFNKQSNSILKKRQRTLQKVEKNIAETRMLSLESLLDRFPRMVRDLSVREGKPVKLDLIGTNTLVDKAILEKLYDPLVHLVRNAFDHGIEPPEIRKITEKPEEGKIEIAAYHRGDRTYIEVRDNGGGINLEKVRQKAVKKKIISEEEARQLSPEQLYELLFLPDFSTKEKVSDLSGRGMGLEAVRRQIESLKGTISLSSELGKGTVFTMRLPWKLTITKLLVFNLEGSLFAISMNSLAAIVSIDPEEIEMDEGKAVYSWQGKKVPLIQSMLLNYNYPLIPVADFQEAIASHSSLGQYSSKVMLVLISQDSETIAIKIDRVIMEQSLTIKPFDRGLKPPDYLSGCTILGDGRLVPVIDGIQLLERSRKLNLPVALFAGERSPAEDLDLMQGKMQSVAALPTVLIIDDSLTTRQTLSTTLQKAGFNVIQASDGWEGLAQLQQNFLIRAVICDVEMPNMNGLEFLSRCRKEFHKDKLPVIMVTSRSSDRYRQLAKQLKSNGYLTKPYLDRELIELLYGSLSN